MSYGYNEERQRLAIAEIEKMHGRVVQEEGMRGIKVDLVGTNAEDSVFAVLRDLPELRVLLLGNTQITDAGLERLGLMRNTTILRELDLKLTKVTDAGLAHLAGLKGLESLDI